MSAIAWHLDNATRVTYILHSKTGIINRCSTSLDRAPEHREKIVYRAISTTTSTAKTDEPTGRLRRPSGAQAILQSAKDRYEKTGKALILIHTPGTGELTCNAQVLHSTDVVYSDLDIPLSETLPPSQPRRKVDLAVIAADNEGYVKTYIVLPYYLRIKLVEVSLARKQGGVVGEGKNYWPNVDVNEMADLYLIIFKSRPLAVFCTCRIPAFALLSAVAVGLARRGIGSPEPTPFSKIEAEPLLYALSTNSRADFEMLTLFSSVEVARLCPNVYRRAKVRVLYLQRLSKGCTSYLPIGRCPADDTSSDISHPSLHYDFTESDL
ncbi:hypothetical protein ARMSODRAFT_1016484 [Armillaria solidipes]|uniref:Uncharacterized protein n=1 Tax=Armillaria solidipes TaxID=1076256 RepID=A0A2H3BZY8_9AGAR|nr:hypothetical protein ARMSODRAFT_1016484 [Armillaria solidipes]